MLSIEIGETESWQYWLSILNNLKNRGVRDIMVICADGLSGIKTAIEAAFPITEYQHCVVHMVRNTLKHESHKHKKDFAADLKMIYHVPSEEAGHRNILEVKEQWDKLYPNAMIRWVERWAEICPIFKYSQEVRKALYTTNLFPVFLIDIDPKDKKRKSEVEPKVVLKHKREVSEIESKIIGMYGRCGSVKKFL